MSAAMHRPVRMIAALLLACCGLTIPNARAAHEQQGAWLFAYFKEPGSQGIYLALSRDGYHYTPLNDGQPWVKAAQPGELMRDVFLTRGPDGLFHMVWTWNWRGNSLGYASSPDLITWSEQREIPVMADFPETNNVWAPETYWDAAKKEWLLIWSSSMKDSATGNRIWFSLTPDFKTFSKPAIFFDPGYVTIDATIFHGKHGPYRLIFKEQTYDPLTFQERVATGPTLEGPWSNISGPINESWSEGPSAIQVGKRYIVFYDHYRPPRARYEAVATTDWKHWEDVTTETSLPALCKHGSFLKITDYEAARLMVRHDAAVDASPASLPSK
ncbi:MAG: glycoside hydrolase family 43 protein [Terracidiphilus sp.]